MIRSWEGLPADLKGLKACIYRDRAGGPGNQPEKKMI